MESTPEQLEIIGQPPYIGSWSAVRLPGFIIKVLDRWQRNFGRLPTQFALVACPQVEVNAIGGLPARGLPISASDNTARIFSALDKGGWNKMNNGNA